MDAYHFTQQHGLRTGDRLITDKGPLARHHSIFVQVPGSVPLVAENQAGGGVQYITLADFLSRNGTGKIVIQKFEGSELERENIVARVNAYIGSRYHLVNFNCEHFANVIQTGTAVSRQVAVAILGVIVISVGLFAFGGNRR